MGKQDGFGRYMNTNRKVRHGEWKDGKRIRWVDEEHDLEPESRHAVEEIVGAPSSQDEAKLPQDAALAASPPRPVGDTDRASSQEVSETASNLAEPDHPPEEDVPAVPS